MTNEELVLAYQSGDKTALNILVEQNNGIVNKIVNKFYTNGTNSIDRDDLIQEGLIGLIIAAGKYDLVNPKKASFITYAVHWIYSKVNRYITSKNTNAEVSLNIPTGEDGGKELHDYIEGIDYTFENIEDKIYYKQLRKEFEEVMGTCNTLKEREILKLHYGWDNNKTMTFEEIGEIYHTSRNNVIRIENKALRKIRNNPWGRNKAQELYQEKLLETKEHIEDWINVDNWTQKYLSNEVLDLIINGGNS